jgi:long-subunit acyl-CoA synthetase (AMP-forming)
VLADIRRLFSHCRIVLNYGLTETYRSCYLDPKYLDTHQDTIGKPIPGVDVVIVREDGTLADVDETGEIVHRGDYICLGYWADAEATALAIRPDPVAIQG